MHLAASVLLALGAAIAFAVSTVGQQRAAARTSDEDARRGRFFLQLLRDPRWLAATLGGAVGFSMQGAALGLGSVFVVQPILVTSLLFALPLSARLAGRPLGAPAVRAGLLLTVSLSVFELLGNPSRGVDHGSPSGWLVVTAIGLPTVAGCLIVAYPRSGTLRVSLLAVAVGVLGGVLAVLTKAVVDAAASGGIVHLLATGETYGLIVVGLSGIYLQQLCFQAGSLQTSLPIMTVLEPATAALLGVVLLHEQVQHDVLRVLLLGTAGLLAAAATVALARMQGRRFAPGAPSDMGRNADGDGTRRSLGASTVTVVGTPTSSE